VRRPSKVHRVHRRLVRQALQTALLPTRQVVAREAPVLGPAKPFIEAVLATDREAPRKQQHTAHRIWERIRAELGIEVAESAVRTYVALGVRAWTFNVT
jgi:hypothetical protein